MTFEATLGDGTSINLTVSPGSTSSSSLTTSTTLTHTSFSFEIHTSPSDNTPPRKVLTPEPVRSTTSHLGKRKRSAIMPAIVSAKQLNADFG